MPELQRAPSREYLSPVMDSRRWNAYRPRSGDVVVATYPKCGTTWTQRIVDLLIHQNAEPRPIQEQYPWLDSTLFATLDEDLAVLEGQRHRRAIKSHLPFDALPVYGEVKYVHVARDGRDACFSFHNHWLGFTEEAKRRVAQNSVVPLAGPPPETPEDPRAFYLGWIDAAEGWTPEARGVELPFFEFEMTYWRERIRPNLLLVHYNDLKADLAGEMRRIGAFLEIETPEPLLGELAKAASFEAMKAQGESLLPQIGVFFDRGADRFLNKGTNGRWKDVLTADDLARYEALTSSRLPATARAWIEGGRLGAGDPRALPD